MAGGGSIINVYFVYICQFDNLGVISPYLLKLAKDTKDYHWMSE